MDNQSFTFVLLWCTQIKQAKFYDNIIKVVRGDPEYFKVAFYGLGFPTFLRVSVVQYNPEFSRTRRATIYIGIYFGLEF